MKITIGEIVKNIPKQFVDGVFLISKEQLEAPKKIRLTPFERFLFAEAAWRSSHVDSWTRMYLKGFKLTHAAVQFNRAGQKRYIVFYDGKDGINAMAVVPRGVYNKCPIELRTKDKMEW